MRPVISANEEAVLQALWSEERTGRGILRESQGELIKGGLYTVLQRMTDKGLIERCEPGSLYYRITEQGRESLHASLDALRGRVYRLSRLLLMDTVSRAISLLKDDGAQDRPSTPAPPIRHWWDEEGLQIRLPSKHKPILHPPPLWWDDEDNTELTKHLYATEPTTHYQCYHCHEWWAVRGSEPVSMTTCPHCTTPARTMDAGDWYETQEY